MAKKTTKRPLYKQGKIKPVKGTPKAAKPVKVDADA